MTEPLHCLLIEDDLDEANQLIRELSRGGFAPIIDHRVANAAQYIQALQASTWDVIISAHTAQEFSAGEALPILTRSGLDIPFLVVSNRGFEASAVELMRAGAHDYLEKESLQRLPEAVRREIREACIRREQRETQNALTYSQGLLALQNQISQIFLVSRPFVLAADLLSTLADTFQYPFGAFAFLDKFGNLIQTTRGISHGEPTIESQTIPKHSVPPDSWAGRLLNGYPPGDEYPAAYGLPRIQAYVCAPIVHANEIIGFLHLGHTEKHAFSEEDRRRLEAIAKFTAPILYNYLKRQWAEDALVQYNRDLESARERQEQGARELEKSIQQLAVEKERALSATKAKNEFLANMSHEIRTPVSAMIGMSDLLWDTQLSEDQAKYVEILRDSGRALLRLINDILDFSKIEARKLELSLVEFDPRAMLDDTLQLLTVQTRGKELKLVNAYQTGIPAPLLGDPGRLRQILFNLGINAIKFTEQGQVTLQTQLLEEDADHCVLLFSVIDTGIGIPRKQQPALFSPFTQLDGSAARKFGGTGLGLAISRQLTHLMQGEIGVESTPGSGSRFWFSARLLKPKISPQTTQPPRHAAIPSRSPRTDPPPAGSSPFKILLAEDNRTNQMVALAILRKLNLSADTVENGQEALLALKQHPYNLILMDCQMPEMDGLEATRRIRNGAAGRQNSDIPIIALTAHAMAGDRELCLGAGMNDYLTKPVSIQSIADALHPWLDTTDRPPPIGN